MTDAVTPFHLDTGTDQLEDLRQRLAHARWPEPAPVDRLEARAFPLDWLRDLSAYWAGRLRLARCEGQLDELPQFRTELDGLGVHFIHVPFALAGCASARDDPRLARVGRGVLRRHRPAGRPRCARRRRRRRFHVVCPSLPGYGFSDKPRRTGVGHRAASPRVGRADDPLGYDRYGAQGGDSGASCRQHRPPATPPTSPACTSIWPIVGPDPDTLGDLTEFGARFAGRPRVRYVFEWGTGYALRAGHTTADPRLRARRFAGRPGRVDHREVLGVDGPRRRPDGALSRDQMLDNITLYWLTATAASSARLYWESGWARPSGQSQMASAATIPTPTAISIFPRRSCGRRGVGARSATATFASTSNPTAVATSPHGSNPSCSSTRCGAPSARCAERDGRRTTRQPGHARRP